MTLRTLITSDVSAVVLNTDHFAETVTRQIGGRTGDTETQTGIVFRDNVESDTSRGKGFVFDYVLNLAATACVTDQDAYLINNERCAVVRVDKSEQGMQGVYLRRVEGVRTEARTTRNIR